MRNDLTIKLKNIQKAIQNANADACLVSTNVNLYYCTGNVYTGYCYIPAIGKPLLLVKAGNVTGDNVFNIRKPEQISEILNNLGYSIPKTVLLEMGETPYAEIERLKTALNSKTYGDATSLFRKLRTYKTAYEIEQFKISSQKHIEAYKQIPEIYISGMTDLEFQYKMEYIMRKHGSLGYFRVFGSNMEIFMGSVLAGDNAEFVSPYDYALGGAGSDNSLPIGANGTLLKNGMSLMVDMGGSFTPYISDITRTFSIGKLSDLAYKAHDVSLNLHNYLKNDVKPGTACADIYNKCIDEAEKNGLSSYFMGTKHQAKFVGHGTGLQINEFPILTSRSKEILEENMVVAFEPKFVIPKIGAVGIENTYLVTKTKIENLSLVEEKIIDLEAI